MGGRSENNYSRRSVSRVTHLQNNRRCIPVNQGWNLWAIVHALPPGRHGPFLQGKQQLQSCGGCREGWVRTQRTLRLWLGDILRSSSPGGWPLSHDPQGCLRTDLLTSFIPRPPPHTPSAGTTSRVGLCKSCGQNSACIYTSAGLNLRDGVWDEVERNRLIALPGIGGHSGLMPSRWCVRPRAGSEESCSVQDVGHGQHVNTLLIGQWWSNGKSASSTFCFQLVWDLLLCGQQRVTFFHLLQVSMSAKQLKGHDWEPYL